VTRLTDRAPLPLPPLFLRLASSIFWHPHRPVASSTILRGQLWSSLSRCTGLPKTPTLSIHISQARTCLESRSGRDYVKIEVAKVTGTQIGEPKLYMIEELYFDDEESMQKALASADGKAVAPDMMESARDSVAVFCIIVMMSFTYNIAIGMTAGFVVYPLFKVLNGRMKEVKGGMWVLGALSLLFFVFYPF